MKIVVLGKTGQLAWELAQTQPKKLDVTFVTRDELDITRSDDVQRVLSLYKPDVVINAVAYTAVDKAETEKELAYAVNHLGSKHVADFCHVFGCRLIHVSTDFVFDGVQSKPYSSLDATAPLGVYGDSKLEGEKAVLLRVPSAVIVRTSWVYSSHGKNFVKTMLGLMQQKSELGIVMDQIGSPTWAKGLAKWIWEITARKDVEGIYHWSDAGVASWYDFAVAIQEIALELKLLAKQIPIRPIKAVEYPTPAARPGYSVLDKTSAESVSGMQTIHWRTQLRSMLLEFSDVSN